MCMDNYGNVIMNEGIEKASEVIDIFLGALNQATLLIAQAEDQMTAAHSVWDRPGGLASQPRLILNRTRNAFSIRPNGANKKRKVFQ